MWQWSNTGTGCQEMLYSLLWTHLTHNWTHFRAACSNWTYFEQISWIRQSPGAPANFIHSLILWCFRSEKMNSWKTEIRPIKPNKTYDRIYVDIYICIDIFKLNKTKYSVLRTVNCETSQVWLSVHHLVQNFMTLLGLIKCLT